MAKILYLSCHEILAYDEVSMLQGMGHEVFSPDNRVEDGNEGNLGLRPGVKKCLNYDSLMEQWHRLGVPGKDNKENLSVEFLKQFDLLWIMHIPKWISSNWPNIKAAGIPTLLRTIGQNAPHNENIIRGFRQAGLKIVRYSPKERIIPGYVGEDATIRFYKDPEEYTGWTGENKHIITFGQSMKARGAPCNYAWFEEVTRPFPRKLYGPGSEDDSFGMGKVEFPELKSALREHRAYWASVTWPASYVLTTMEAWITGIPIVAIGPEKGHPHGWFPGLKLYEVPELIENGVDGFCSDSKDELQSYISELMNNDSLAKTVSENGRKKAISLFGKETIQDQWNAFLKGCGV